MNSVLESPARIGQTELAETIPSPEIERVIEFYEEASLDYGHWSTGFNMHLGFYRWGANPFDREKMLEQMNLEIAGALNLDPLDPAFLIDLGCGLGAVSRSVAAAFPRSIVKGVTISPGQVAAAIELNERAKLAERIEILEGDYTNLPFGNDAADGVWAVESACYAKGPAKADLVAEMARVLKTGGRFAVADCFIRQPQREFNFLIKRFYRTVCDCWALGEFAVLDNFVETLESHGFREITVKDISWRIAPSLAHAPFAVLSFLLKHRLAGEPLKHMSSNNLKASLLALALGLNRSKFSYCLITGRRGNFPPDNKPPGESAGFR